MSHTPGPWCPEDRGANLKIVFKGEPRPGLSRNAICALMDGEDLEREANARLIAAAPDLLIELKQAAVEIEEAANLLQPTLPGCASLYDAAAIRIRAAISKAEGTAP